MLLFLFDSMRGRGGMERVTASVANGLADLGFDVQISCRRGQSSSLLLYPAVQLKGLGLPAGSLRMRSPTLPRMRAVQCQRPDVLIAVDTSLNAFAFPVALDLGIHRLAWEHFNFRSDLVMRSRCLGRWVAAHLSHHVFTLPSA